MASKEPQRWKNKWLLLVLSSIAFITVTLIIIVTVIYGTGFDGYDVISVSKAATGTSPATVTITNQYQPGKTLWDWMQLLIVPVALALVAILFNRATTRSEQKIAQLRYLDEQKITEQRYQNDLKITLDRQREDLLQAYLDRMSELLLDKHLNSSPNEQVRKLARVRTTTVLFQLDARRIGYVFSFLQEAGLMSRQSDKSIISLSGANLRNINFSQANLMGVNLSGADLTKANLKGSLLLYANLSGAKLVDADLSEAILGGADLSGAYLWSANLSGAA